MGPKGEKCGSCYFWERPEANGATGWGECHRHAPAPGSDSQPRWPDRRESEWCGEHQPKIKIEVKKK